jgi:phage-related protein
MWQIFENLWSRFYDLAAWFWWASGKIREDFSWFPFGAADWLAGGVQWLGDLSNAISRGMLWLYEWLSAIDLEGFFANFVSTLRTIVTYYWGKISWFFVVLYDKVCRVFGDLWDRLADFLYNLYDRLWQLAIALWDPISNFFVNLYWRVNDFVITWWDRLNDFFTNLWPWICTTVADLGHKIGDFFTNLWPWICTTVADLGQRLWNFLTNLWPWICTTVTNLGQRIDNLFTGEQWVIIGFFLTAGYNFLKGFVTDPLGTIWAIIYPTLLKRIEEWLNEQWDRAM